MIVLPNDRSIITMDYKYTSDEDLRDKITLLIGEDEYLCAEYIGVDDVSKMERALRSKSRRRLLQILEGTMSREPLSFAASNRREKARFEALKEAARIAALPKTEEYGRKLKALMSEIDEAEMIIQAKRSEMSQIRTVMHLHKCEQLVPGAACYLCGQNEEPCHHF